MNSMNLEIKKSPDGEVNKKNIEVWEGLVYIKDLVMALLICSVTSLGGYFLAPKKPPKPLIFGLCGAILGFVICSILIKPKRTFIELDKEN